MHKIKRIVIRHDFYYELLLILQYSTCQKLKKFNLQLQTCLVKLITLSFHENFNVSDHHDATFQNPR